ncbi:MAG: bifunctional (p)ppGpp synthetase/guanosine-3',5'-bis(diphosphate) 3'-pyrophosphohydrolase [Gammaproteobacteria bacterium]|nr:bifunctional (p)ppGpp synthetase/guanosine-3',5'-bis(diphosphate) 3'-pyrophosphohydrolase [Gammaproteobacteria bacterium]
MQIDDLCEQVGTYLPATAVANLRRAFDFGAVAHEGQQRASGEPYIQHPLQVASILADMHMDQDTLIAALLHDTVEDTSVTLDTIRTEFGGEVAAIVDGLSKLTQIEFESQAEAQAQNFQKMVMAMANDIRVILVKLADRLHNMRTLDVLSPAKRRRIARETLDIYAPIALRLGINRIRLEFEELCFAATHPFRYAVLTREVEKIRGNRKEIVQKIGTRLKGRLRQEGLAATVIGREKHLYSIYQKMREKHLRFSEVHDVYAFRILVGSVDTCYRVLGAVHAMYKPVPGKFKDYIALPKANGYQSLHTVLFGPYGVPIEVQIRTHEMDQAAEAGIAAHWTYKTGDKATASAHKRAREWLRGVMELQQQAGNSQEFLEHVKVDLFPDTVYVFTPKGDIRELPRGSTPVDLAYSVHTDVGNRCVACRINNRLAPLHTALETGQTVEIVTAPGARPNPAWLAFIRTAKARANIRHYLKNLRMDEASLLGRRMLNRELERLETRLDDVPQEKIDQVLQLFKQPGLDNLLTDIGLGDRPAQLVARAFVTTRQEPSEIAPRATDHATPLLIQGTEGMVVTFPKCCFPIPGDRIVGFVSAGRGLVIHRQACSNIGEFRNAPERWVDVRWADKVSGEFTVELHLDVLNQRGVLATVASAVADEDANIKEVETIERDDQHSHIRLQLSVPDRLRLAAVLRTLRAIRTVVKVSRK